MKGYGAIQSPFVRKVRVAAFETGQGDLIDWEMVPMENRAELLPPFNPLVKIPVIILDDGSPLYDSAVICEYLDSLHDGPKLFPEEPETRWTALRLQALGDGVAEAMTLIGQETRRPEEFRYQPFIEAQLAKINNGLDVLDGETELLAERLSIGPIAVACALGYLDFRDSELGWRDTRPALADWFKNFASRVSMSGTVPRRP